MISVLRPNQKPHQQEIKMVSVKRSVFTWSQMGTWELSGSLLQAVQGIGNKYVKIESRCNSDVENLFSSICSHGSALNWIELIRKITVFLASLRNSCLHSGFSILGSLSFLFIVIAERNLELVEFIHRVY